MNRIPAEQGGDTYLVNGNMLPLDQGRKIFIPKAREKPHEKFWNWNTDNDTGRILTIDGTIARRKAGLMTR